jgi:hypothetical protein
LDLVQGSCFMLAQILPAQSVQSDTTQEPPHPAKIIIELTEAPNKHTGKTDLYLPPPAESRLPTYPRFLQERKKNAHDLPQTLTRSHQSRLRLTPLTGRRSTSRRIFPSRTRTMRTLGSPSFAPSRAHGYFRGMASPHNEPRSGPAWMSLSSRINPSLTPGRRCGIEKP